MRGRGAAPGLVVEAVPCWKGGTLCYSGSIHVPRHHSKTRSGTAWARVELRSSPMFSAWSGSQRISPPGVMCACVACLLPIYDRDIVLWVPLRPQWAWVVYCNSSAYEMWLAIDGAHQSKSSKRAIAMIRLDARAVRLLLQRVHQKAAEPLVTSW